MSFIQAKAVYGTRIPAFPLSHDKIRAAVPAEVNAPDKVCGLGCGLEKLPVEPFE